MFSYYRTPGQLYQLCCAVPVVALDRLDVDFDNGDDDDDDAEEDDEEDIIVID